DDGQRHAGLEHRPGRGDVGADVRLDGRGRLAVGTRADGPTPEDDPLDPRFAVGVLGEEAGDVGEWAGGDAGQLAGSGLEAGVEELDGALLHRLRGAVEDNRRVAAVLDLPVDGGGRLGVASPGDGDVAVAAVRQEAAGHPGPVLRVFADRGDALQVHL